MPDIQEERYQDNGFELIVYKQRKADPFETCPECGRKLFPVAGIYDEWQPRHAANTTYHHCKKCKHILQTTTRQRPEGNTTHQQYHHIRPHELLMELLAHARHIQGRGITRLTLNKRWWSAWRYPLTLGDQLPDRTPRVTPRSPGDETTHRLEDDQALHQAPLPRYEASQPADRNPFTNRRVRRDEADGTPDEEPGPAGDPPPDDESAPSPGD